MSTQTQAASESRERSGYFEVSGAHLYTVLHQVREPVARVLLVGPFASGRNTSYLAWLHWARFLAARQIEVLRYDYRGIGESTGVFEELALPDWIEDVRALSGWLQGRTPEVPLVLVGLELGALLAGRVFDEGTGDALLLWSPPPSANHFLRTSLSRWAGLQQLGKPAQKRKPFTYFVGLLESGQALEVEGYRWTSRLWQSSFGIELPEALGRADYPRPVKIITLGKNAASLVKGGAIGYEEAKDYDWLFAANFDWIASALASARGYAE